jgi:GalNAc-alpha-(1->4)-GalNAc-alpha-(1->3)-diNAcBac-PP-undecaprenol alpha-1,4-N-acetyl-D-galactosaminyltransferase
MKKHRITFLINSLSSGGAERVLTTLANNFIKTYEVSIITFINTPPFYNLHKDIKVVPCFEEIKLSSNPIQAIRGNYTLLKRINNIVKENNCDLLISFMTTSNILGTVVGKLNKIPVIISERTNPYHQQLPKIWNLLRTISYRYTDVLVVQTETIRIFFEGKINETKLSILPNPITNELTNSRNLGNYSKRENIILSVGRLIPSKAHDILIRAFAQTNHKGWELWIAGDGPEYDNLKKLINELRVGDQVKLLGLVKNTPSLYNKSKIFAFSSTYEGFPNALIEAMHFGLACVSSDCPTGPAELIKDGENGFLVPMNDIKTMGEKLTNLMENPSKLEEFGKKSILAVQQYDEESVAKQWKAIVERLIK